MRILDGVNVTTESTVNGGGSTISSMGLPMGVSGNNGIAGIGGVGAMGGLMGSNGDGRPPPPPHSSLLHMAGN